MFRLPARFAPVLLTAALITSVGGSPAAAAAGQLDTSFGNGGITSPVDFGSADDVAQQSDGKLLALGGRLLVRFTPQGTLDSSFGSGGTVRLPFAEDDELYQFRIWYLPQVAVQRDDGVEKVLVLGRGNLGRLLIARFLPNGSPDRSFGENGVLTDDLPLAGSTEMDLVTQPDGRIIVAATHPGPQVIVPNVCIPMGDCFGSVATGPGQGTLTRLLPDGGRDTTFGVDGRTTLPGRGVVGEVLLQPDGKILVAAGRLYRLLPDGTPDLSFGVAGQALASAQDIALGREIVAVSGDRASFSTISHDGRTVRDHALPSGIETWSLDVAAHPERIVIVDHRRAVGFTWDGALDPSFGTGGYGPWIGMSHRTLLVQPDGKIVAGGGSGNPHGLSLARYLSDGPVFGSIAGSVTQQKAGSPIAGASVDCGDGLRATTGGDGRYSIANVPPGSRTCVASASGFDSATKQVSVKEGATAIADFVLRKGR